jgi:hypothetical protein
MTLVLNNNNELFSSPHQMTLAEVETAWAVALAHAQAANRRSGIVEPLATETPLPIVVGKVGTA